MDIIKDSVKYNNMSSEAQPIQNWQQVFYQIPFDKHSPFSLSEDSAK